MSAPSLPCDVFMRSAIHLATSSSGAVLVGASVWTLYGMQLEEGVEFTPLTRTETAGTLAPIVERHEDSERGSEML